MNVCLVSQEYPPDTGWGGIGTYTRILARGLAARGHAVRVVSRATGRPAVVDDGPVRVHRTVPRRLPVPGRRWFGRSLACLAYSAAVARVLARLPRPDVVEFPNWNAEGVWHLVAGRRRAPVVTRVHSPYAEVVASRGERVTADKRWAMALERAAVRRADVVVTHSRHNAAVAARLYGLPAARIAVVHHGLPLPPEPAARTEVRPPTVLFVGRLERRKGIHVLLEAIPDILRGTPGAEIVIAGRDFAGAPDGRTWRAHADAILPAGARERVRFLGHVDDDWLARLYAACDVVAAPSLYESFGLVFLEAMAHARAVVACRVAAVPEVVADGETGVLVPPGDARALAAATTDLLRDPGRRAELGRRGRERVERLFSEGAMVDGVIRLYEAGARA